MTRHGLTTIHPATHPPRETMAFMPDTTLAGARQRKPGSAHCRNVQMQPITAPRPTPQTRQTGRYPPAKLRPNPKSP